MIRQIIGGCLFLVLLQMPIPSQGQPAATNASRVTAFHAALVTMMKLKTHAERAAFIEPHVLDLFDVPRIASISLGRTWRKLDEQDRSSFRDLLSTLIVATYADRFKNYADQVFSHKNSKAVKNGELVRTQLATSDRLVRLDYFFRDGKVFNVAADGVSDLSLRRADYASIVKNRGYAALLNELTVKIEEARGT